jgi:hypothetical protein
MIKEIKYRGQTASPSDYEAPDGDFSMLLNAINDNGSIERLTNPKEVFVLEPKTNGATVNVEYVHKTSNFTHFIISEYCSEMREVNEVVTPYTYHKLYWRKETIADDTPSVGTDLGITIENGFSQITSVGNTLIILTDDGLRYFLWQDNNYTYLGDRLPEISLSFGLQAQAKGFATREETIRNTEGVVNGYKTSLSSQLIADTNTFISQLKKEGKFIFPFFVRYAYRLYDGSLTMHSAPIFMACASDKRPVPLVFAEALSSDDDYLRINSYVGLHCVYFDLDYAIKSTEQRDTLKNWEDIIKSVDVFISSPIYTYDQNYKEDSYFKSEYNKNIAFRYADVNNNLSPYGIFAKHGGANYERWQHLDFIEDFYGNSFVANYTISLPKRNDDDIKNDIENCSLFYFLHKIDVKDLQTERTIIPIKENYLNTLEVQEVMTDDYDSHDTIIPKFAHVYNSRLNLANIKKKLYNGGVTSSLLCYSNKRNTIVRIFFHIKENGKEFCIANNIENFDHDNPFLYIYYPNINAYKATVYFINIINEFDNALERCEIPLTHHSFLNGAYAFVGWDGASFSSTESSLVPSEDNTINLPNKIYTSEVNNPFYFPVANINTIGVGEILGMNTVTQALSQGQYGQFPLYIFASDGIWSAGVSQTGGFSVINPLTRDVCINSKSITAIDNAVLFASDKGIMMLAGGNVTCITNPIDNISSVDIKGLPKISALTENTNDFEDIVPFKTYLVGCEIVYDYKHQHIILLNQNRKYIYVFSLKTNTWAIQEYRLTKSVHSYPEAYAVMDKTTETPEGFKTYTCRLLDFSQESNETSSNVFAVTRPMQLDAPNIHKTISSLIQRGVFDSKDTLKQILYGSNDLVNWFVVWSSKDIYMQGFRGTPYKYYRIAFAGELSQTESFFGCTIEYNTRFTNKLR